VRGNVSYVESYNNGGTECVGQGTSLCGSIPRLKGAMSLDYDNGPWSLTATANYVAAYDETRLAASYNQIQSPAFQTGLYGPENPSNTTLDLFVRYRTANKWSVSLSVINALNKLPPYNPGPSATFLYDFTQFDVRGRQLRLGGTYKFW
jgi:iron complex outermembrane receptor protein